MIDLDQLELQYITNRAGEKTAVVLSIEQFQEILEDLADLAVAAERRDEPTVPHDVLIAELKQDGILHD